MRLLELYDMSVEKCLLKAPFLRELGSFRRLEGFKHTLSKFPRHLDSVISVPANIEGFWVVSGRCVVQIEVAPPVVFRS